MSMETLLETVRTSLGISADAWLVGAWHLAEHGAPPRYVWLPTVDQFDAPGSATSGGQRWPRNLYTQRHGIECHVWAETYDDAVARMHGVLAAMRDATGNLYEPDSAIWDRATTADRGWLVTVSMYVPLVVTDEAITATTTTQATAIACDEDAEIEPGYIGCPCPNDDEEEMAFATQHFNIGKIGSPSVADAAGTPDVEALAVFSQLNVANAKVIDYCHLHGIDDQGSGSMTVELWRRRAGVMTSLGTITLTGGAGDYATATLVPADRVLQLGDYLYCQLTAYSGAGGYDGITVDVHFE